MLRFLLFPFAILYHLATSLRNYQYDNRLRPFAVFDLPVIGVGNLTVGGTGKTPMIEHLIRLLTPQYKVATLSRGYGRRTKGFRLAGADADASTVGDEPLQFFRKYGSKSVVAVGEDRAYAIPRILQEHPDVDIMLLDDAFQHRRVQPSLNILLSDYNRPFYNDFLLPAGRLRESRAGAKRADVVIVTKCPADLSDGEIMTIEKSVRQYVDAPLFFTRVHYGTPLPFGKKDVPISDRVFVVTGIAEPAPFIQYLNNHFNVMQAKVWDDHHHYSSSDLQFLADKIKRDPGISIITTEKDMVKLDAGQFKKITHKLPMFYIPIEVDFLKDGKDFDEIVLNHVRRV